MTRPRRRIFSWAALAAAIAVAPPALAGAAGGLVASVETLPADVSLVIAIDNARDLRGAAIDPSARGIASSLMQIEGGGELSKAWSTLSKSLGMPPADAFDELLGRRAVYISRPSENGAPEWGIITTVSRETERRLREAINPAPRQPVKGKQILAVEDGRFLMGLVGDAAGARGAADGITIAITPESSRALFLRLIAGAQKNKQSIAQHPAARRMRAMDLDPSLVMLAQQDERWGCVAGTPDGAGLSLSFAAGHTAFAEPEPHAPFSRSIFGRIRDGAAAAFVEHDTELLKRLAGGKPFGVDAEALFAMFDGHDAVGPKLATRVDLVGEKKSLAIAVESTDDTGLAIAMDSFMAKFLAASGYAGQGVDPLTLDFGGVMPEALRSIAPRDGGVPDVLFGGTMDFAWCLRGSEKPGGRSWWISSTRPTGVEALSSALLAVEPAIGPDDRAWVMLASFEPGRLVGAMTPAVTLIQAAEPRAMGVVEALGRIERVTLESWLDTPSSIRGTARIELVRDR